jgi:hypothetical protein
VRRLLHGHPAWSWRRDFLRESPQFAELDGVPVFDPGPHEATALVVCELGKAVRKVERHPPSLPTVRVAIDLVGEARATAFFEAGRRVAGVSDDPDSQTAAMRDGYVEIHVDMDVEWVRPARAHAAWRIELPPADDRRRSRGQ